MKREMREALIRVIRGMSLPSWAATARNLGDYAAAAVDMAASSIGGMEAAKDAKSAKKEVW